MNTKTFIVVSFIVLLTGCTTYKTSTKTTFDSIQLNGKTPIIHVGDIHETPDQISLLGWVDASVTQSHWFADKPTEEQVNIILAEKGAALGADAIIYVSYNTQLSPATLFRLEGRGQAVKLKTARTPLAINATTPTTVTQPETNITAIETTGALPAANTSTTTATNTATNIATTIQNIDGENVPTTLEAISAIKIHNDKLDTTPISLKDEVAKRNSAIQLQQANANTQSNTSCTATINDINDYQTMVDSINYMIMNTEFLIKKSRGIKNGDMESASSRLLLLLQQQLDQVKKLKPTTSP